MKLSHSKINTYQTCPMQYKLHYIDGYREDSPASMFFMGSGVGTTWQMMILDRKEELTDEEKEIIGSDPYDFFDSLIATYNINGRTVELPNDSTTFYFKGDFDSKVLTEEDKEILENYRKENGFDDFCDFDMLYREFIAGRITNPERAFLNLHFWMSLRRKGHMLIDEFKRSIDHKIIKVYEIEGPISLKNGAGDEIIGFLDLLCDYQFEDGVKKVIIDFKTASQRYSQKKLDESQQLNLYDYDKEVGLVGYIVGVKTVKTPKRGERSGETYTEIQELFGSTSDETQENIIGEVDNVLQDIKAEKFPMKNSEKECRRIFGRVCPFYNICWNGDDSRLFKTARCELSKKYEDPK